MKVMFWKLSNGNKFYYEGKIYIKTFIIGVDGKVYNACNLSNGFMEAFDDTGDIEVIKIN